MFTEFGDQCLTQWAWLERIFIMASFNKVILVGNLTRDPELRYTQWTCDCQIGYCRQSLMEERVG